MTLRGLRRRWRGMVRRRLMGLRGRIDRRIERLDEKRQRLDVKVAKRGAEPAVEEPVPVTGPATAVSEAKRPSPEQEKSPVEAPENPPADSGSWEEPL